MEAVKLIPGNNLTERQLVAAVLQGDKQAFGNIIKNTERLVAQIVFKMIVNAEDRKDLVQDIYLKAFNHLERFRFESKLLTWIGNIAYNTCINYLEKKKLVLSGTIAEEHRQPANLESETEKSILQKDLNAVLANGIEKLSPLYKTLIVLYHQEGLSYAEIAQITVLPEGTVKSYLFRARKALKENILMVYKNDEL